MTGRVIIIGAGPGDPELVTLKAVRALAIADAVLVDDLVDRRVLAHVRPGARVIAVGKRGGCRSTPQAFILRRMIALARAGLVVARLKGGDPFVFGRGGEEVAALTGAGIPWEVVSGVTAGLAAPAELGIPVTHRDLAHGVTLLTGHRRDGGRPDWAALRAAGTTLVIYMGLARTPDIVSEMLAAGYAPQTPSCAVRSGTLASRRQVLAPLAALPAAIAGAGMCSPAVLIIGDVVSLAAARSPLAGDGNRRRAHDPSSSAPHRIGEHAA